MHFGIKNLSTTKVRGLALALSGVLALIAIPTAQAQTETILHSFAGQSKGDGLNPYAGLIKDAQGNFYGTTGGGMGTVFKVTASGAETVLYSFRLGADGNGPLAGLIMDSRGNLYGTTGYGGTGVCNFSGCGTIFKLTPSGTETILHNFVGTDGALPEAGLIMDMKGNLYGTATRGGAYNSGTIFKITVSGTLTVLHNFGKGTDGSGPGGGLAMDSKGNIYGTTAGGGAHNAGTVFKVTASSTETVLHSFGKGRDGALPEGGLVMDANGNLYGTTLAGGAYNNNGTVFRLGAGGTETVLHSFGNGTDGSMPYAGLVLGANGNLYGTTLNGGAGLSFGTIFEISASGTESVLHSFNQMTDGSVPIAGLIMDSTGNLYGTTNSGGTSGVGTVFKLIP